MAISFADNIESEEEANYKINDLQNFEGEGPAVAQWVKYLVSLQLWCSSQLRLRINPWPETLHMPWVQT